MFAKEHAINFGNFKGLEILLEQGADLFAKDIFRRDIFSYLDKEKPFFVKVQKIISSSH